MGDVSDEEQARGERWHCSSQGSRLRARRTRALIQDTLVARHMDSLSLLQHAEPESVTSSRPSRRASLVPWPSCRRVCAARIVARKASGRSPRGLGCRLFLSKEEDGEQTSQSCVGHGRAHSRAIVGGVGYAAIADGGIIQGCYDTGGNVNVVSTTPCPKATRPFSGTSKDPRAVRATPAAGTTGRSGAARIAGAATTEGRHGTHGACGIVDHPLSL
jgi:hypothetical protein